jgi:hypothetical protein
MSFLSGATFLPVHTVNSVQTLKDGLTGAELEYLCTLAASLAWIRTASPIGAAGCAGAGTVGVAGNGTHACAATQLSNATRAEFTAALHRVRAISSTGSAGGPSPSLPGWEQVGGYGALPSLAASTP